MRIYIRQSTGRTFHLPIPLSVASFCCHFTGFILRKSTKYIPQNQMEYIDCIDFKQLSISLKQLKDYKGLKLVEVKTINGDEITIVI